MNILHSHINEGLRDFAKVRGEQFQLVFERLHHPSKIPLRGLLIYVNNLIDIFLESDPSSLKYHHIHFPEFKFESDVILEFLCVKFCFNNLLRKFADVDSDFNFYENHINKIGKLVDGPLFLRVEDGQVNERRIREKRIKLRILRKELTLLNEISRHNNIGTVKPKCLINVTSKALESLQDSVLSFPYFTSFDYLLKDDLLHPSSYVLVNKDLTLDDFDTDELNPVLDQIEDVVLFDSEGRRRNFQYNYSKLIDFNQCGTNFRNLIVISFDHQPLRLNRLISQQVKISARYHERVLLTASNTYTILPYESHTLVQQAVQKDVEVKFVGENYLIWAQLVSRISHYEDLSELVSIKMRNIYSLCCTEGYKLILMRDLFSDTSSLLTPETKERISLLNYTEAEEVKLLLARTLDLIIDLNIPLLISRDNWGLPSTLVLPYSIVNHPELLDEVKSRYGDLSELLISTWKSVTNFHSSNVIILEYRDPGRSPYLIYPNLFENSIVATRVRAYLVKDFFDNNYGYSLFEFNKALYRGLFTNKIRKQYFKWHELSERIDSLRPVSLVPTDLLDLDDDYTGQGEKESILIKLLSGSKKGFHPSQLFVYRDMVGGQLSSIKAEDLIEENLNKSIFAQPLDELYEGLKLFQATIEEETEIQHLKKSFNINENDAEQRIWKILLKRKSEKFGVFDTYFHLKKHVEEKGLLMVREDYFASYWLEVNSDMLIPRSKRVFQVICSYLSLPEVYLVVMLKKRARERFATRKSTNKMNQLIAALVDYGFFDVNPPVVVLDGSFLAKYELDEIGINELNLSKEIAALVELLKPNLDLKEIRTVERKKI